MIGVMVFMVPGISVHPPVHLLPLLIIAWTGIVLLLRRHLERRMFPKIVKYIEVGLLIGPICLALLFFDQIENVLFRIVDHIKGAGITSPR